MRNSKRVTVGDREQEIREALAKLRTFEAILPAELLPLIHLAPPPSVEVKAKLLSGKGRKKKSNADVSNWRPEEGDRVQISYRKAEASGRRDAKTQPEDNDGGSTSSHRDPTNEIVLALQRAESDPQLKFVSLKWFRDKYILEHAGSWTLDERLRRSTLIEAISGNRIITNKVPNPLPPHFPTTAIRLNRLHPEIQKILSGFRAKSEFEPVSIRGEALSRTVLSERR